jgi:hypothetical protein
MLALTRVRSWHVAVLAIITTVAVATVLAVAAAEASKRPVNAGVPLTAPLHEPMPAYASYRGWGQVAYASYGTARLMAPRPVTAWEWNAQRGWVQRSRSVGERVYIWPYAAGWSWTWTQSTGWYAMQTSALTIGYRPIAVAT